MTRMADDQITSQTTSESGVPTKVDQDNAPLSANTRADISVWMIWAVVMLCAVAALPFAVRSQDVVRAIASMCGIDLG